jgi:hypothetical protein
LWISDWHNDLWKFNGEEWVWVSGTNVASQRGIYGQKGISDSNNYPGGRSGPVSWMDKSGNMWIFGGYGYPTSGSSGNIIHVTYKSPIVQAI